MTELQEIEFQMLKTVVQICEDLQLTYFLVCGSALGAAKYQGFIPWDDDVDVALPRPDYEVFCEKAQALLPDHLFLQNSRTEKNYPLIFSKVRNSATTYVEKAYAKTDMNQGVYIDVFPLDGYPQEKEEQAQLEREKYRYGLTRLCCLNVPRTWKTHLLVAVQKLCGVHQKPARFVERFEKHISQYHVENSEVWCNHGNWQGKLEYAPREQYGNGTWALFEGLKVRIPEKIDEYLTQKYGNWQDDLPEKEKVGHHYYEIMDLNRSYMTYAVRTPGGKITFQKSGKV